MKIGFYDTLKIEAVLNAGLHLAWINIVAIKRICTHVAYRISSVMLRFITLSSIRMLHVRYDTRLIVVAFSV